MEANDGQYRQLTDHRANPVNDTIAVTVMDDPGAGGAHHHYMVTLPTWTRDPDGANAVGVWDIQFQNGPIAEKGVNGLTQEVLLAIVADRLRCFQAGPFKCHENAMALINVESALDWLKTRTKERMARNVEGTNVA